MTTWILSDRVLCADFVTRPLAVGVESGHIAALLPRDDRGPWTRTDQVFDWGAAPIVPGWVNAHVHLAMAPLRGITTRAARRGNVVSDVFFQLETKLTAADVSAFTRLGAVESLLCGVTEVWDHYYYGEAVAEALLQVGLPGVVAPTLQDLAGPGARACEQQLDATRNIAQSARLRAAGITAAAGPHASDTVSPELLAQAGKIARELELPVHMHFMQSVEEKLASSEALPARALLTALGDCPLVVAHALLTTQLDIRELTRACAVLGFCPLSQAQFGVLSPIEAWCAAGGTWALGTDTVASNDSLDLQRELALLAGLPGLAASFGEERDAVLQGGAPLELEHRRRRLTEQAFPVEPEPLLAAAWGLGLPGGPRGIQVGAKAGFLVLDEDHPALFPEDGLLRALCCGSLGAAVQDVFVRDRFLGQGQDFRRVLLESELYRDTLAECRARRAELLERAGLPA